MAPPAPSINRGSDMAAGYSLAGLAACWRSLCPLLPSVPWLPLAGGLLGQHQRVRTGRVRVRRLLPLAHRIVRVLHTELAAGVALRRVRLAVVPHRVLARLARRVIGAVGVGDGVGAFAGGVAYALGSPVHAGGGKVVTCLP